MADHYVDIVNEKDEVVGKELKSKKPQLGFISRVVAILLKNAREKYIVCKRAPHKKNAANLYDLAAFGNVGARESYEDAARRELKEELDIECDLNLLDKFYQEIDYNGRKLKIFCGVFLGQTDEEPKLNHELVSFRKMSLKEIEEELKQNPEQFCPGFINDFNKVKEKLYLAVQPPSTTNTSPVTKSDSSEAR